MPLYTCQNPWNVQHQERTAVWTMDLLVMTCQWWFINCHKCSTLVGGLDSGGGCWRQGSIGKFSVLFTQFCSEPKTALYKLSTNLFFFFKVKSQQFYMVYPNSSALLLSGNSFWVSPSLPPLVIFLAVGALQGPVFSSHSKNPQEQGCRHLRLLETPFHVSCSMAWKHWATASTYQWGCRLHLCQSQTTLLPSLGKTECQKLFIKGKEKLTF